MSATTPTPEFLAENRAPSIVIYNSFMIAIPTIAVALRFWSRALTSSDKYGRFWWDDWMVLAALPWSISTNTLVIRMAQLGLGKHVQAVSHNDIYEILKILWAAYFTYDTGLTVAKSSALLFFARVFENHSRIFKWALWVTQVLVWSWWVGILCGTAFMCSPVSKNWIPDEAGWCGSTGALWLGSAIPSVIIDIIILLLPMPMLWKLQVRLKKKLMILSVFICGYCVVIISIGRLVTVVDSEEALNEDLTWAGVAALYWLCAEGPITILSICLPSFFSIFRRVRTHGVSSLFSTHGDSDRDHLRGYQSKNRLNSSSFSRSHGHQGNTDIELSEDGRALTNNDSKVSTEDLYHQETYVGSKVQQPQTTVVVESGRQHGAPSSRIHVSSEFTVTQNEA